MAFLALDLGGSHATCAVVDRGSVLASEHIALTQTTFIEPALPEITRSLKRMLQTTTSPVEGLGVGFCGLVDSTTNRVTSTNGKFVGALQLDFVHWSERSFGLPLRLENDARLALRGEMSAGAAKGISDVVMFTLGTGIGGVAAMDGQPLRGAHGQAGVLAGHVPVRMAGRRCTCGGRGCAEAEASGWALPAICREWPSFAASVLSRRAITFLELFRAASEDDRVAIEVRDHCLEVWGMMTVAAVHAFDPQLVIFGGGVMGAAAQILPFVREYVSNNAWVPWGDVRVEPAALGTMAALLGVPALFGKEI